ncbi:MAG: VCBS repeat-containing protein, partial [Balneolaceae bacterium]
MGAKNKTIKYLSYCYLLLITLASCRSQETQEANGNPKLSFEHVIIDSNNPPNPHCKTVGDINGDDLPDILAASDQGDTTGLFWYEYPNWTKYKISGGSFTTDMQVGDIDNDGDLDVIIPKGADPSNTVWWYENPRPNGMPSEDPWIEHKIIDAGAHDVELADMNRDGMLDVVIRLGNVSVLLQGLNDSWINIPINTGGQTGSSLEDINGDG